MEDLVKTNTGIVNRWVDAVNSHDIDKIMDNLHDEYEYTFNDAVIKGRKEVTEAWKLYLVGIPDLQFEVVTILGSGEYVAARFRVTGTNKGPFRFEGTGSLKIPVPATNKPINYEEASFFKIKDGKIINLWSYWDTARFKKEVE